MQRVFFGVFLACAIALAGCGGGKGGVVPDDDDMEGGGPSSAVTVTFESYCQGESVTVYKTNASGSECTLIDTSGPVTTDPANPNAYSASTTGSSECTTGTRVEITQGSNSDVSYDISTNAAVMTPAFFNVPVQFLALQNTAPTPCALPIWDGGTGATDLRGVSSQVCSTATCATAYQTPTSGPQFITKDTAASSYVVEWCPEQNTSPLPICTPPPFDSSSPCPNVCWEDAVTAPFTCAEAGHVMCNTAPFGGTPPESYCLLSSDCAAPREPCGCCTSDSDCSGGESCVNFLCQES
jgi:hypothetical protein